MQQIELPLQNTTEGMAKACFTKAPERDRCRLRLQPDEMAFMCRMTNQPRFQ